LSFLSDEHVIEINDQQEMVGILGRNDEFLRLIDASFDATVMARGNKIIFSGSEEENQKLEQLFKELLFLYRQGLPITSHDVRYSIYMVQGGAVAKLHNMYAETLIVTWRGHQIKAKTLGQWNYVRAIKNNFITFGIGPAGTGKTYLAVAMAVTALKKREVERIILTRPAVEAGEKLGFLPGDLQEKVDPYLRPLYDALFDMLGSDTAQKYLERGTIEVAPLAYMRGRTLNGSFIILDEAQNTTPEQMKMILTRFGFGSHMVVTGDVTQVDLPIGRKSGLVHAAKVLKDVPGISINYFDEKDVVRHEIVGAIIKAYEQFELKPDEKKAEETE
jgi:phosphate starvation-inducible PhoH-like protein